MKSSRYRRSSGEYSITLDVNSLLWIVCVVIVSGVILFGVGWWLGAAQSAKQEVVTNPNRIIDKPVDLYAPPVSKPVVGSEHKITMDNSLVTDDDIAAARAKSTPQITTHKKSSAKRKAKRSKRKATVSNVAKRSAVPPSDRFFYTVQAFSTRHREIAEKEVANMMAKGYAAQSVPVKLPDSGKWYRVRVGHFATRKEAIEQGRILVSKGLIGEDFWISKVEEP